MDRAFSRMESIMGHGSGESRWIIDSIWIWILDIFGVDWTAPSQARQLATAILSLVFLIHSSITTLAIPHTTIMDGQGSKAHTLDEQKRKRKSVKIEESLEDSPAPAPKRVKEEEAEANLVVDTTRTFQNANRFLFSHLILFLL